MSRPITYVAVVMIRNKNNQILIAKRNQNQVYASTWEFPGGKVELGETCKLAAIREVQEEVGLELEYNDVKEYDYATIEMDNTILNITYYLVDRYSGTAQLTDQLDMKWVDISELVTYKFPKPNYKVISKLEREQRIINTDYSSFIENNTKLVHNYTDENNVNHKVLGTIVDKLLSSNSFKLIVAFATNSGVSMLLSTLIELENRNVRGTIIIGTYLEFTDPVAIEKLNNFNNIDVYINNESNLHAKSYIFEFDNTTEVLMGSSNLTSSALTTNLEWNLLTKFNNNNQELQKIHNEFDKIINKSQPASQIIDKYRVLYNGQKQLNKQKQELYNSFIAKEKTKPITANVMQSEAIGAIQALRDNKLDKGLVISSTGSGKTILAALDAKQSKPNKLLFIVHRENIAIKAMKTFKQIIPNKSYGLYTGKSKDNNSDYLFATIQSLVNNLKTFNPGQFDYIIIDEVHHGGAKSYQQVFNYFKPDFYLGLTATPERTDGFDIFKMFDYNIAYEYRLDQAMSDNLLAPFHYFGVSDITIDNVLVDEKTTINNLTADDRVKHIVNKLNEYTVESQVNGLMFVSSSEESQLLSAKLNKNGFKTTALGSNNSEAERQQAIDKLDTDELDYIITVDIFNEGIDIPAVNQVVLLRPTKSAIVYVQQIGRGLRKHPNKDYVTIIDFIGNYKNNYLVPVAISNDHTYNKDKLKKDVIINGINSLQGESVIQFEQIVQGELIKQITNAKLSTLANIKHDYNYLKAKLDRRPMLIDFVINGLMSPLEITKVDIYPRVISKIEKEQTSLSKMEELHLEYLTKFVLTSKRQAENLVLSEVITNNTISIQQESSELINAADHYAKEIFTKISDEYKYLPILSKVDNTTYKLTEEFKQSLSNSEFKKHVIDILQVNRMQATSNNLQVNTTYTRKEAYKYLLKDFNNGYQVGGYTVFDDIALIFITLDDSNSFTQYDNELLNNRELTWFSKSNRKLKDKHNKLSAEGNLAENKVDIHVFTKRNSSDEFYYLGLATTKQVVEETKDNKLRYKYTFNLNNAIQDDLYKYLQVKGD